jgi:8-oxo-dGTP pyrophosphatase MutT (NUDIX family)
MELSNLLEKLNCEDRILNRDSYKNSAVLIPIVRTKNGLEILFEKRAQNITQGGEICFPGGGKSEKDKSFKECAVRETCEELGIEESKVKVYKHLPTLVNPTGHIIEVFLGELLIKSIDELNINSDEVAKVFTVPINWFLRNSPEKYKVESEVKHFLLNKKNEKEILLPVEKLKFPPRYKKPWGKKIHDIYLYEYEEEVIWGLTALITNKLINKIQND